MQHPGKPRGVGFVIVLAIFTFGIYTLYWIYKSFSEIKGWRGQGVGGFVGLLLSLIPVSIFLLPSYVGRLYKEDLIAKGEDPVQAARNVPITGWSGFLTLIPFIGGFIWLAKVQGRLNNFWEGQQLGAPPAAQP
jgi:apolipoprotein N-acyltransferase